jgi:DNA-binding response OmpR family regulator
MVSRPLGPPALAGRVRRHILVVDDDPPSREGLGTALLREGHTVETAADAWQAIVRLRARPFDVAVVDLDLPPVHGIDLGGWDVVRIARAYRPGIGVIVLSSDDDSAQDLDGGEPGTTEVLGKPISLQELTGLLERLRPPHTSADPRSPVDR